MRLQHGPERPVELLLRHLGLEWTDGFERSFAALELSPDRADAYRDELTPHEVEQLDRALGTVLEAHGYPSGG